MRVFNFGKISLSVFESFLRFWEKAFLAKFKINFGFFGLSVFDSNSRWITAESTFGAGVNEPLLT